MFYILVDTNENYYNCGHYPEWEVEAREGQPPAGQTRDVFKEKVAAEEEAAKRNKRSKKAWNDFLRS